MTAIALALREIGRGDAARELRRAAASAAGAAALNPNFTLRERAGVVVRVDAIALPAATDLQLVVAEHQDRACR